MNFLNKFKFFKKPINFYRYSTNCTNGKNEPIVVRESYKLISPKYNKYSYAHCNSTNLHLLCDTVGDRINSLAIEKPDNIAYKFCLTQKSLSFKEIKQRTDEIGQSLLNMGFKKGDRLAVILPNVPELVLISLACASIGVIVVLMNPAYQLVEIEYMLKKTKSKGIVILDNLKTLQHYEILTKICPELLTAQKGELISKNLPDLKHVILVNNKLINDNSNKYNGTWSFDKEIQNFNRSSVEIPNVDFDDSLVMLFTSGTTGLPKAAVLSHYNLLNSAYLDIYACGLVDASKVICCPIPIFHSFGLIGGVLEPLVFGGKTVFPHLLPDTLTTIKAIHSEKCTAIKGAPVIFIDLINHPERKNYDLSSLEYMLIGASNVPKILMQKIKKELNLKHVLVGYGMTESSAAGTITRPNDNEKYAYESIGQPFPFVEVKIIDSFGKLAQVNTDGEICIRGYNVMKEYWDEPEKTAEAIDKNGWLHTGDIGCMDENGNVTFKARAKELIIRGGVNIYPAEIESFLRTHPNVLDTYCFGLADPRVGEEVCVWIKLKPNSSTTTESIIEFCKGNIAYFKIPKHIKFVDSFPINANGKVQKFKMVEQMKKDLGLI